MYRNIPILFIAIVLLFTAHSARAGYYVWNDPDTGVSLKVPDTWRLISKRHVDEIAVFHAPGNAQHAQCSVRVRDEPRYRIYPEHLSDHVVQAHFSQEFWDTYAIMEYNHHYIHVVREHAGLGHGFATMADISYVPHGHNIHKRAIVSAGFYNNKLYTLSCSAEAYAFVKWYKNFQYVLGSLTMKKQIHELPGGDYRHFAADPVLRIHTVPKRQNSDH